MQTYINSIVLKKVLHYRITNYILFAFPLPYTPPTVIHCHTCHQLTFTATHATNCHSLPYIPPSIIHCHACHQLSFTAIYATKCHSPQYTPPTDIHCHAFLHLTFTVMHATNCDLLPNMPPPDIDCHTYLQLTFTNIHAYMPPTDQIFTNFRATNCHSFIIHASTWHSLPCMPPTDVH